MYSIYIAKKISEEAKKYLEKYFHVEMNESSKVLSKDEIIKKYNYIDGLITAATKIDKEFLENMPNLKVVSNISVGYDNFVIEDMKKKGVIGTNTPNVLNDTVADLTFALILGTARRICEMDKYVKNGMWKIQFPEDLFGADVHHSTLGIIGMGRIGEAVAKRAKLGFDMKVLYHNRSRKEKLEKELGAEYVSMEELLKQSDFVVLLIPLSKETYHIMDYDQFSLMKKSAIFINVSRGKTVNEQALAYALKNKLILAAGLDVYEEEPINKDNPLLKMENIITMPHVGSATLKTRKDMVMVAAKSMVKALNGEELDNNVVR